MVAARREKADGCCVPRKDYDRCRAVRIRTHTNHADLVDVEAPPHTVVQTNTHLNKEKT